MSSFWNLFMLFVAINIPFAFVTGAFEASPEFDSIDFGNFTGVDFPDSLKVDYTQNPETNCGTADEDTLIGTLCIEAEIQNLNITAIGATGSDQIVGTQQVGIFEWIDQISDFGQMIVFGVSLLFSAVTGGFIVSVLTSFLFADQFPPEFLIGIQVFIGLMWLSFFFKQTIGRQLNPAE